MSSADHYRGRASGPRADLRADTAREHLGDRLAAFVDGELGDDARERVLSHLATCDVCRGEADEQRRLKDAVAGALPPALSAALLARLQGLPAGPPGGSGPASRAAARRGFAGLGDVLGPSGDGRSYLAPAAAGEPLVGFPVHPMERPASRGRRLAFAAAGAFSLAALALGVAVPLDGGLDGYGAPEPAGGPTAAPLTARVDGRRTAEPDLTPVAADVARPVLSRRDPRRAPASAPSPAPRSDTPGPSPTPSRQPPRAASGLSPLPARVTEPPATARPGLLPLLGGEQVARVSGALSAPRPEHQEP